MKIDNIDEIIELQRKNSSHNNYGNSRLVADIRSAGVESIKKTGFPVNTDEEWRYTNIKTLLTHDYKTASAIDHNELPDDSLANLNGSKLVFINGIYHPELSELSPELDKMVIVANILDVLEGKNPQLEEKISKIPESAFAALNSALFSDGACIIVPDDVHVKSPVHILHYTSNTGDKSIIETPRNIVILGKNSHLNLIDSYMSYGDGFSFINILNQFWIEENARFNYYKVQKSSGNSNHIQSQYIKQGKGSETAVYYIDFSGPLTRNTLTIEMDGTNAKTLANGIYFAKNSEIIDNNVFIDHAKEDGVSSELYRGILTDKSRGVFKGKIMVRQDAQRTDAEQNNNCLLLSDDARINTMPQLEIYADDVKCTHGATIGELDEESIFYLQTRGIGREQAKNILIKAFIAEVIEKVDNKEIKMYIEALVDEYLGGVIDV